MKGDGIEVLWRECRESQLSKQIRQTDPCRRLVLAATNRDLEAAVANGISRQDLFYRLNVFPIEVPPLREPKDDLLLLVEYFAQRYGVEAGKKTLDLL
jgi:transcriptional regulator with GAF, ATPase, and Fis domain